MKTKFCGSCKQEKPEDSFNKNRAAPDGLQWKCRSCCSAWASSKCWKRKAKLLDIKTRTKRTCSKCLIEKPLHDFHKRKLSCDGYSYQCKACDKASGDKFRKSQNGKNWKKSRDSKKLHFIELRGGKCLDCGITPGSEWPLACFDFHHVGKKDHSVSELMNKSIKIHYEAILSEINKCIVLCSNCHKRRHHKLSRS